MGTLFSSYPVPKNAGIGGIAAAVVSNLATLAMDMVEDNIASAVPITPSEAKGKDV